MCRRAASSAVIRRANTAAETQTTAEIKYCDDLFHKGQTGGEMDFRTTHTDTSIDLVAGPLDACGGCPHYFSGRAIFSNLGSA